MLGYQFDYQNYQIVFVFKKRSTPYNLPLPPSVPVGRSVIRLPKRKVTLPSYMLSEFMNAHLCNTSISFGMREHLSNWPLLSLYSLYLYLFPSHKHTHTHSLTSVGPVTRDGHTLPCHLRWEFICYKRNKVRSGIWLFF